MATPALAPNASLLDQKMGNKGSNRIGMMVFGVFLLGGLAYIFYRLFTDLSVAPTTSFFPYFLLGVALLIALALSSSTASTTPPTPSLPVIYTHSLEPQRRRRLVRSAWNFVGVLT